MTTATIRMTSDRLLNYSVVLVLFLLSTVTIFLFSFALCESFCATYLRCE